MLAFWLGNYRLEYKICVLAELTRLFITATALCTTLTGHSLRGLSVLTVYQGLAGNGLFCHLPIKCFLHVDNTYLPFRLKDPQDTTIAVCFPHCTTGVQRQRQLRIVSSMPAPFCAFLQEDLKLTSVSSPCFDYSANDLVNLPEGLNSSSFPSLYFFGILSPPGFLSVSCVKTFLVLGRIPYNWRKGDQGDDQLACQ